MANIAHPSTVSLNKLKTAWHESQEPTYPALSLPVLKSGKPNRCSCERRHSARLCPPASACSLVAPLRRGELPTADAHSADRHTAKLSSMQAPLEQTALFSTLIPQHLACREGMPTHYGRAMSGLTCS